MTPLLFATLLVIILSTYISATTATVGTYISAQLPFSSAIVLTINQTNNVLSLTLPPGDWDVRGLIYIKNINSGARAGFSVGISTVPLTLPQFGDENNGQQLFMQWLGGAAQVMSAGPMQINVTVTTTVYLVGEIFWVPYPPPPATYSPFLASGFISARGF
jgi:hypothetical protein